MAGPRDILRSIDNTGRDAFRAAGRWAGRALGNLIAPVIGGAAAGAIGDAIGRIAYRTMQIFAAALAANFILTIVVAAILVVFTAFALFIINSGAYIVPPSTGTFSDQGPGLSATELCFNFTGFPENILQTEVAAAQTIAQAENYVAALCSQGPITVRYSSTPSPAGFCGQVLSSSNIVIFNCGTGNLGNTLYTLAHESGHIHQFRSTIDSAYYQSSALSSEGFVCTYPYNNSIYESYAELIALYIGGPNPPAGFAVGASGTNRINSCWPGGNFQTGMPETWQFARDSIFLEDLEW
ncbi:hypothetical protein A2803_00955 [Candidatus Woesebacteria bacterium RIFCSPHIGHO2_01_FULL_44_21]|uniref:Uncharacterized protein n=1 Tax=Candidatus Woesebacteria bacterium RIFCSPHIGHO2_01_FULL_44_21 TaxID=1802503 RepID=A0A1F7YWV9_9BACT|nr:MAG: hypothetical protein A2803_00955 [Candidatus Woesebacteria bacterium RIFCSPHIGHO2_01_FULL_44_21]OGM69702.1 MAG: hypothetical protein A2897_00145 [Candidatus Woesebacteria bacterium RIFCSPLOWO2_01_FULL_44_24b]